jgi:hypothetical protein
MGDRAIDFSVASLAELHAGTWTEPFWAGTAKHVLLLPRCTACGTVRVPGAGLCWRCRGGDVDWVELEPRGRVFTHTVVRHAVVPEVRDQVPYVVAVVELDAAPGVRLIGNLWRVEVDEVRIGLPVEIVWDDIDEGVTIPRFAPAL